jgi:hypothetical protein
MYYGLATCFGPCLEHHQATATATIAIAIPAMMISMNMGSYNGK